MHVSLGVAVLVGVIIDAEFVSAAIGGLAASVFVGAGLAIKMGGD